MRALADGREHVARNLHARHLGPCLGCELLAEIDALRATLASERDCGAAGKVRLPVIGKCGDCTHRDPSDGACLHPEAPQTSMRKSGFHHVEASDAPPDWCPWRTK